MLDSTRHCIELLGMCGYHAKYIQKTVRGYEGDEFSVGTIYKVLKEAGIKIRDYRDGIGDVAKAVTKTVMSIQVGKDGTKRTVRRRLKKEQPLLGYLGA